MDIFDQVRFTLVGRSVRRRFISVCDIVYFIPLLFQINFCFRFCRYTAGVIPVSMEKIHGMYDSDNSANGHEAPAPRSSRLNVSSFPCGVPQMLYGRVDQLPEPGSRANIPLRMQPTADFEAAKNRRLQEMSDMAAVVAEHTKKPNVGKLKVKHALLSGVDDSSAAQRRMRDLRQMREDKPKDINEKIKLLRSVMEADKKGGGGGSDSGGGGGRKKEKTRDRAGGGGCGGGGGNSTRKLLSAGASVMKPSLAEKRAPKPVNVDILCGSAMKHPAAPAAAPMDDELDNLLGQLEFDESFQKLSDNEKMSWLESLFYQDTKSKVPSIMRRETTVAAAAARGKRQQQQPTMATNNKALPNNSNSGNNNNNNNVSQVSSASAGQLASRDTAISRRAEENKPSAAAAAVTPKSSDVCVNENLISLAQSYFNPSPAAQQKKKKLAAPPAPPTPQTKASTTAAAAHPQQTKLFSAAAQKATSPKTDPCTPTAATTSIDNFISVISPFMDHDAQKPGGSAPPPPIPPRSVQPKTTMLRLMNSATNILKK